MSPHPRFRPDHALIAAVFFGVIAVPGLARGLDPAAASAAEEVVSCPALPRDVAEAEKWLPKAIACFNTQFAYRKPLITLNAWVHARLLGTSTSSRVLVGRDRWLLYADEQGVADFRGLKPLAPAQLQQWQAVITRWADVLASRHTSLIVAIMPNKPTIYPESAPSWMTPVGPTRLDQLMPVLQGIPGLLVADARGALRKARSDGRPLYLRTDSHWNQLGALEGWRAVLEQLQIRFGPMTMPDPIGQTRTVQIRRTEAGDLARMLTLEHVLTEDQDLAVVNPLARTAVYEELPIDRSREPRPRVISRRHNSPIGTAVVFRDSFSEAFVPWLGEYFDRAVYVWSAQPDLDVIDREKPDVVILEGVERWLMQIPPAPPPGP